MGGHTAILAAAAFPDLVARLIVLEATVAGGADPARIGRLLPVLAAAVRRPRPTAAGVPRAATRCPGRGSAHLEPAAGGGLIPPFDADVMQAVMEGVAEPALGAVGDP